MSSNAENEKYREDPRIPCQYGIKCYQKNEPHHKKYKHPPKIKAEEAKYKKRKVPVRKRKIRDRDDNEKNIPGTSQSREKIPKVESPVHNTREDYVSSSSSSDESEEDNHDNRTTTNLHEKIQSNVNDINERRDENTATEHLEIQLNRSNITEDPQNDDNIPEDIQNAIQEIFLVKMPADFYKFYDFCKSISKDDPSSAFKAVNLKLVGPYDVLSGKIDPLKDTDKEKYLRHWRYYYDPPEFQTIIKGSDQNELHFGYWRDDPLKNPAFVAKNAAKINSIIEPVAENLFGAVNAYLEEKEKTASLFEKSNIIRLHRQLKNFAKENNINLEKNTPAMRSRERNVVARTFHKAGIVVPYQKKTQLGYRDLSVTDTELRKIIKEIDEASSTSQRGIPDSKLEEVMRLAIIAADECDFGTCLELGHDLFSSGVIYLENKLLQILSIAYTHLQRTEFLKIIEAHLKDRKKGSDLSVI